MLAGVVIINLVARVLAGVLVLFSAAEERLADAHGGGALAARSVARGVGAKPICRNVAARSVARGVGAKPICTNAADGREQSYECEFGPVRGRGSLVRYSRASVERQRPVWSFCGRNWAFARSKEQDPARYPL